MRLAAYNVENLFERPRAMNLESWEAGQPALDAFAELSRLLARPAYDSAARRRMEALLVELGLERSDTGPFVRLRRNRGRLLRRPRAGGVEVVAEGRADWAGGLELRHEPVTERAMQNTARVMIALEADLLAVVEAESRPSLVAFDRQVVAALGGAPHRHVMLIDGNDERGIDVGLMTREGHPINPLRSHVDDLGPRGTPVFRRDCPEFTVGTPSGETLVVLVAHFKSRGGDQRSANAARRAEAARAAEIVARLEAEGVENLALVGDLNDTPDSAPLAPLLRGSRLRDAFLHPAFDDGGHPGTWKLCNARDKIDYLLLSPALFERVRRGGVERRGMWPGSRPRRWETFPEVVRPQDAASDHAAIWVDLDV